MSAIVGAHYVVAHTIYILRNHYSHLGQSQLVDLTFEIAHKSFEDIYPKGTCLRMIKEFKQLFR